ncbi:2OG-Fe(II) oxygenase family protein [Streptomyces luteogriseus]|uniref:2OG-Fe(II) oxygenase family protein n=1 Tax=Streptomyces luteogriseus TaxID=68233 RepID=UPI0026019AFB|nr:2OG-Fe(II) oxygenase family protein [uncultured Streptomyces sp.]
MTDTTARHASPYGAAPRTSGELDALGELLTRNPARPVHLDGFLLTDQAARVAEAVREMPQWASTPALWNEDLLATRPATPEEFRAAAPRLRAALRQVAQDIPALFDDDSAYAGRFRRDLSDFFVFAGMGPVLVDLLARWVAPGGPLTTNIEFARYDRGDFLGEHSDTDSDTLFVLNLYLDEAYARSDGGILGFRNEQGEEFLMPPRYNSLSVMPIRHGCVHWVTPWLRDGVGRQTVSIAARLVAAPAEAVSHA